MPPASPPAPPAPERPEGSPAPAAARRPPVDLAGLAAAVRSIERGESPVAPAPRGDAAEARRKRREAMAAEAAALQAAEAADGSTPPPGGTAAEAAAADGDGAGLSAVGAEGQGAAAGDVADAGADAAAQGAAAGRDAGSGPGGETAAEGGAADGRTAGGAAGTDRPRVAADDQSPAAERPGAGAASRGAGAAGPRVAPDPRAVEAAAGVLADGGAPAYLAADAVRVLGERAAAELRADPWLLLGIGTVRTEHADAFARGVLGGACGPDDERRARALVARALEDAAVRGHTALPPADLHAALRGHGLSDPEAAVAAAVADGQVLVFREGGEDEDSEEEVSLLLGLDRYAMAEESLAEGLFRLLRSFESEAEGDDGPDWARASAPTPSAAELIKASAGSGLVVHSGGEAARAEPAALVAAARAVGLRAYAAAYTENGRRRLAAVVGDEAAVTVDGLLSGAEGPGRAADGSLDLALLAVLDAPQLSVEEATTLVESVPDGARLVLSGDPHALWSAGAGRVFADLLAARVCPRVVSRTPDFGPIGELVSCVGEGELTAVEAPGKEVVVVPVRDPREAVHRTVQLVADSVPRAFGVEGAQVQVVTTGHGGPVGTRALNAALKERLNPGPGRFGGFDPGDRIVHVPVPGRTLPGTVTGAEPDGLRLECERGSVLVPREEVAATVRHGWAVTGHQAAGMRWPAAVVVVPGDAGPLLTRSWVYTAFGRGERHLSVVQGAEQQLAQAVAGPPATERTTRLGTVLRELTAGW
ncbi:helix-hairpin-helix domain-containing protein [Streptomyces sp. NBC_01198]|uniref:helix-hairpin-helix domain-containing protein n=1 Tax=Streptomyces sp. NBC_01198 TaxID=2903769 RepID=UPI002E15432E|nr:DNA helicase RecD [Streptomyces sp. NBC_01198]